MAGRKGSTYSSDFLKLTFNATAIANIADNASSAPLTNLFCSLHTANPAAGGSQTTSEAAYVGYARVSVARTSGGFTVTGASVSPAATVSFATCSSGTETETFGMIGTATSGTGKQLYSGPITPNIAVSVGVSPQWTTASAVTEA